MSRPIVRLASRLVAVALFVSAIAVGSQAAAVDVQEVESPGGIRALLVEDPSLPLLAMRATWTVGAATDPEDKPGLASMTAELLTQGAGDLDAEAFQRRLVDESIGLGFDAGQDGFFASLRTLSDRRDDAFGLLRLALEEPRFDADAIERLQEQVAVAILSRRNQPNDIASRVLYRGLFGDHPYARRVIGTTEGVEAVTAEDVRRFVETRLALDNLVIGVAGDIDAETLGRLLDETFGGLPEEAERTEVPVVDEWPDGGIVIQQRPIPQSVVMFGQEGIAREDPDWFPARIANYVLGGGGFSARLTEEVREKRGLVYTISTSLVPFDHGPIVLGRFGTDNRTAVEAIRIVREEWARMGEEGVSESELDGAKEYIAGNFPLQLDGTRSIAATLVAIQRYDLGIDYLDHRSDMVREITLEEVNRTARRIFDPDRLFFVVVGDPVDLEATMEPPDS